jgi:hypothetical protein
MALVMALVVTFMVITFVALAVRLVMIFAPGKIPRKSSLR